MGFDKDSDQPVVQLRKRTTKVNLCMIIAVIIFFIIGGALIAWFWLHPAQAHP